MNQIRYFHQLSSCFRFNFQPTKPTVAPHTPRVWCSSPCPPARPTGRAAPWPASQPNSWAERRRPSALLRPGLGTWMFFVGSKDICWNWKLKRFSLTVEWTQLNTLEAHCLTFQDIGNWTRGQHGFIFHRRSNKTACCMAKLQPRSRAAYKLSARPEQRLLFLGQRKPKVWLNQEVPTLRPLTVACKSIDYSAPGFQSQPLELNHIRLTWLVNNNISQAETHICCEPKNTLWGWWHCYAFFFNVTGLPSTMRKTSSLERLEAFDFMRLRWLWPKSSSQFQRAKFQAVYKNKQKWLQCKNQQQKWKKVRKS